MSAVESQFDTAPDVADLLGGEGPLAAHLAGFAPRAEQKAMATAVQDTLLSGGVLVCEAGTGTGKTYAYLVPALTSGRRVIISTGTKHLQDQLFHRDLPALGRALGRPADVALLKGRANYVCLHRLQLAEEQGEFKRRQQVAELRRVADFARHTGSGDIGELTEVPEDSPIWPRVTSTTDNCLGSSCPQYSDCFVLKARRRAQEADVVVVNHHLLLADMALKEEGFGDLLPGADAVIVDEAHQLPEIAAQYFGRRVSSRQVLELTRDLRAEWFKLAEPSSTVDTLLDATDKAARDARLALGDGSNRLEWARVATAETEATLDALHECLVDLAEALAPHSERARGIEQGRNRAEAMAGTLDDLLNGELEDQVRWCETFTRSFTLHIAPVEVADRLGAQIANNAGAWIFTSATLAVNGSAEHFSRSLGVESPREEVLGSPFDYAANAVLYAPPAMPQPQDPAYTRAVVEAARPLIEASRGRAFLLFTSHRALREARDLLADSLDYPLLCQGDMPRARLLEQFRELGNAVLLGTSSFWEGVDVKGPALSLVVIDKLPFASPGDPLLKARLDAIRERGGNPFFDYQVPQAVIALKQGVGRLIRDTNDTGVLMLCDPRLMNKSYGKVFLASLPPMTRTRDTEGTLGFLARRTGLPSTEDA